MLFGYTYWFCIFQFAECMFCTFYIAEPISVPKKHSFYIECFLGTLIGAAFFNLQNVGSAFLNLQMIGSTFFDCRIYCILPLISCRINPVLQMENTQHRSSALLLLKNAECMTFCIKKSLFHICRTLLNAFPH